MKRIHNFKSPNKTITRKTLATFCALALITATTAAVSADRSAPRSNWQDGSRSAEIRDAMSDRAGATAQGTQYPDSETMLQMYHAARKDGTLDSSMSTDYPTLAVLRSAYLLLTEPNAHKTPLQGEALGLQTGSPLFQTKAATCRSATLNCLYESAKFGYGGFSLEEKARLFACSMAAAGRNQDSPKISTDCNDIMAGAAACSTANSLCGVVSQPIPQASSFYGSTTSYSPKTITCGTLTNGSPKDRAIRLGAERRTINGVERITRMYMKCSSIAAGWVGTSNTGGTQVFMACPLSSTATTGIEGAKITKLDVGGLRSLKLRCDDIDSADAAGDTYTTAISNTAGAGTEGRAECGEGYYVWGISAYVNDSAPAALRYITGYSYICRK